MSEDINIKVLEEFKQCANERKLSDNFLDSVNQFVEANRPLYTSRVFNIVAQHSGVMSLVSKVFDNKAVDYTIEDIKTFLDESSKKYVALFQKGKL